MNRIRPALVRSVRLALAACIVAAALSPAVAARAEEDAIWIASGLSGGTYRTIYARNLEKLMRDYKLYYRTSSGSQENLSLLVARKADIAFSQADVYASFRFQFPEAASQIQVVGRLADECLYVAMRRGGRASKFAQLGVEPEGGPLTIAVGDVNSGTAGSWSHLARLDPRLAQVKVDNQTGTLSLNQLGVGVFDAVAWVTDPTNFDHKMLRAALANDAIEIVNVTDPALLTPLDDGTVVYTKRKVPLKKSWLAPKIKTICTTALVVMRRDAGSKLLTNVSDTVSLHLDLIVPRKD
jgi:TRAP-type uncharacterized transport system substrate-binding protein